MPDPRRNPSRVTTTDDEEIKVGPVEAESAAHIYARLQIQEMDRRRAEETPPPPPLAPFSPSGMGLTFSLRQLFIGITVLSVWFGLLRWMNSFKSSLPTGLLGIASLAVLVWISAREESTPQTKLLWWAMLLTYATSAIITLLMR